MRARELRRFCSKDQRRPLFFNPWSVDNFTLATDGVVIVRVSRLRSIPENPKAPDVSKLFGDIKPAVKWILVVNRRPLKEKGFGVDLGEGRCPCVKLLRFYY